MSSGRLALGTAQLGQRYGIANRTGPPNRTEAQRILELAQRSGIDTLDTAMSYGDSERVLGTCGVEGMRIVTKLPPLPSDLSDVAGWVRTQVTESLARLGARQLHGLLLHNPRDALGKAGRLLVAALRSLTIDGLVRKTGVSIYDPSELDDLTAAMDVGLVQAPLNVLDRRLQSSGWLERLHRQGTEVHARSIFLQGLLLMSEAQLPTPFTRWRPLWASWHAWLREHELNPLQAALGFVLSKPEVDRTVVGVETAAQLSEIVSRAHDPCLDVPVALACADLELIDPSRWKRA